MKNIITRILIGALLLLGFATNTAAQNVLPAVIDKDMALSGGEYLIKSTTITEGATLTVDNETKLIFEPDAFVFVRGGLIFNGEDNAFIIVRSKNAERQGVGFVFSGNSATTINLDHVRFSHLKKPIEFERNWLRDEVYITNSIFKNLNQNKVPIEIKAADQILINKELTVKIRSNTFSNNYSSMLLTEISSPYLRFELENNVITQNLYFGADQNGIFTSPLFINYNSAENTKKPSFEQNSFVFNFTSHLDEKEIEYYQPFLYAIGTADKIDLSKNYLGDQTDLELSKVLSQIQAEHEAPVVDVKGRLKQPDAKLNGHVYSVKINDDNGPTSPFSVPVNETLRRIELTANRPIQASKYYKIQYRYMEDDTIQVISLNHKLSYTNAYKNVLIDLEDRELKDHPNGYIVVDGFYDINGYDVPAFTIGLFQFLNENRDYIMYFENLEQIPKKFLVKVDPPLAENVKIDSTQIVEAQKDTSGKRDEVPYPYKWDAGVFVGSTIYFGDLSNTGVQFYLPNARPNVGLRLGYRPTPHWRIELAQNTLILTGSDDKNSKVGKTRGTNYSRGLSFRTTVIDLGLNVEYQILRFKRMGSLVPSVVAGISGFYFKPEGEYNDTFYDLRELGTEGQTQEGGSTYSSFSYSIPVGAKLSMHINKRNLICLSYTYHKLFTDYLDDVSTGEFQTSQALNDVNPHVGPIAYELSNPNDLSGPRSYSANYDGFSYWGLTWLYRF